MFLCLAIGVGCLIAFGNHSNVALSALSAPDIGSLAQSQRSEVIADRWAVLGVAALVMSVLLKPRTRS